LARHGFSTGSCISRFSCHLNYAMIVLGRKRITSSRTMLRWYSREVGGFKIARGLSRWKSLPSEIQDDWCLVHVIHISHILNSRSPLGKKIDPGIYTFAWRTACFSHLTALDFLCKVAPSFLFSSRPVLRCLRVCGIPCKM
jgi:hypothetical protein